MSESRKDTVMRAVPTNVETQPVSEISETQKEIGTMSEIKVGSGWRYRCLNPDCDFEVGIDDAFPKECPKCHAGDQWGHLTTPNNGQKAKTSNKNHKVKTPGGITTHKGILSQLPDAVVYAEAQNKDIYEPSPGQGRGRPLKDAPESLIKELSHEGLSSRKIVVELDKRGYERLSYKTVLRVLSGKRRNGNCNHGL